MIPMIINDLCLLRQEDGYINGFLDANGYEVDKSTYEALYHLLLKKAVKYDKWGEASHMNLDNLESIDIFLNYMIDYLRNIDEIDFKKQLLRKLEKIHEENGMQQGQWENENYEHTIKYYKSIMRYVEWYELEHQLPEEAKITNDEKKSMQNLRMKELDTKAEIAYRTVVDFLREQILK